MLVGQIAGFPSVWNCKHSGEGSLGHSRNVLNWGFLEERFGCLHSCFGTAVLTESPVITNSSCSENYMGEKEGEQMLGIPLHTVSWPLVTCAAPSEKCLLLMFALIFLLV